MTSRAFRPQDAPASFDAYHIHIYVYILTYVYMHIYIHHKTIRSAATKYSGTSGSTLIGPMFASFAVGSVHWASLILHSIHVDEADHCHYSDGGTEQRLCQQEMKINIQHTCKSQDESLPSLGTKPPKLSTFH